MNEELSSILHKVRQLYRKYGIRSVTMDDVSRELGISKKTLYQYVHDKDELVSEVIELELSTGNEYLEQRCTDNLNAIEQLGEIAACVGHMMKEYSAVIEYDLKKYYPDLYLKVRELKRDQMFKFIKANLAKGKQEGLYRMNLNVDILSKLSLSFIDSMFESEVISIPEFLDQRYFYEYFEYHLRGIVNNKGLLILEEQLRKLEAGNQI
jgi:AcrR family transcriptional regulator